MREGRSNHVVRHDGATYECTPMGGDGRVRVYLKTRRGPLRRVKSKALAKEVVQALASQLNRTGDRP